MELLTIGKDLDAAICEPSVGMVNKSIPLVSPVRLGLVEVRHAVNAEL